MTDSVVGFKFLQVEVQFQRPRAILILLFYLL